MLYLELHCLKQAMPERGLAGSGLNILRCFGVIRLNALAGRRRCTLFIELAWASETVFACCIKYHEKATVYTTGTRYRGRPCGRDSLAAVPAHSNVQVNKS